MSGIEKHATSDENRWVLAKKLLDFFVPYDDGEPSGQSRATDWLVNQGYDVAWVQPSDDSLICHLWLISGSNNLVVADDFIIIFSGYDAATISLFCLTREEDIG